MPRYYPSPLLTTAEFLRTDPRIASLVERFLPLATYYTAITAFIEEYSLLEHGTVNHALCAAIRDMLTVSWVHGVSRESLRG
jgi:hypothetical protein